MRAAPNLSFSGASTFQVVGNGSIYSVSAISAQRINANAAEVDATVSGATTGTAAALRDAGSNNSYIQLSTEL
jgi:hypothetical protein